MPLRPCVDGRPDSLTSSGEGHGMASGDGTFLELRRALHWFSVKGSEHDDEDVLHAIATSGARALMIGRRALIMLGAPVLTNDYDVWIHIDDIELLNRAFDGIELFASKTPEEARATGRYVFENDLRVDVRVARSASTPEGVSLPFDDAWARRQQVEVGEGITLHLPSIDDLILTKRWGSRPKDLIDIQWLEVARRQA